MLGSRGSVLDTFGVQAEAGEPLTVTHPDVTRYFMTIPEAVHLIVRAAAIGESGEIFILEMGEPIRIQDLAVQVAHHMSRPGRVVFTGLRPGEKLHEDLVDTEERLRPSAHPLIGTVEPHPLPPELLSFESRDAGAEDIASELGAVGRYLPRRN